MDCNSDSENILQIVKHISFKPTLSPTTIHTTTKYLETRICFHQKKEKTLDPTRNKIMNAIKAHFGFVCLFITTHFAFMTPVT